MSTIRLIISDIDGTILDSQHRIDPHLLDTIQALRIRQIPFVLASARSPKGMAPIAEALGITDYPMTCYNGALITSVDGAHVLASHGVDKHELAQLLEIMRDFPQVALCVYAGLDWYVANINQWVLAEAAITGEVPIAADVQRLVQQHDITIHKVLLIGEVAEIQALLGLIQSLSLANLACCLSKDNYLEVTARYVSKQQALETVAAHYHIPLAQTMALGDNFNDVPMIELAGLGVAMGNAPRKVQAAANVVTASHDAAGASAAIQRYVL